MTIVRPAGAKRIKLADIREIRVVSDPEMAGAIRIFGVGGLFGYYGRYYVPQLGSMIFYATRRDNQVYIQTKQGKKIVLTPQNIGMVESLKGSRSLAL